MLYKYNQYNISLTNNKTDIVIKVLDNKSLKKYQRTYDNAGIANYGIGDINNFYMICTECLENMNTTEINNVTNIMNTKNTLILTMHYLNTDISCEFILELHQDDKPVMTQDQLTIQKLSEEVKECKDLIKKCCDTIKLYDSLMSAVEIPVYYYDVCVDKKSDENHEYDYDIDKTLTDEIKKISVAITIPLICSNIDISSHYKKISKDIGDNEIYDVCMYINGFENFNANFKKIMCDYITMHEYNESYKSSIDMSNFPVTIKELRIRGYKFLKNIKGLTELKNLKIIKIEWCPEFTHIYDAIKNLNVESVNIEHCPKFLDRDVLIANNIKCDVYIYKQKKLKCY